MGIDPSVAAPSSGPTTPAFGAPAELSSRQITDIVEHYGRAAERLHACGFDGIQITSMGSHLIEQFWSPALNRRADEYGGTFENRLRLGREVVDKIASVVPSTFLISFRMSGDPGSETLGLDPSDLLHIAKEMSTIERIDLFDITGGSGMSVRAHAAAVPTEDFPEACYNHISRRYRQEIPQPVLVAGRILDASLGEKTIASGDADLVGMTRALIADPDLPKQLMTNRATAIRPCIAINEGCRRVVAGNSLACTVNPAVSDLSLDKLKRSADPGHVIVVGGGPAGMEAARVAAERGHSVTLQEGTHQLGGQVHLAAMLGHRPHLHRHIDWLENELARLSVEVQLNQPVQPDSLIAEASVNRTGVVIATGATGFVPPEALGLGSTTGTEYDVLTGAVEFEVGNRVLIYDAEGHNRGTHLALMADHQGTRVDLVTPFPSAAANLEPPNKPGLLSKLQESAVNVLPDWQIAGASQGQPRIRHAWNENDKQLNEYDIAIFVGYRTSNTSLYSRIVASANQMRPIVIGDSRAPRLLRHAISEGARAGANVDTHMVQLHSTVPAT